ncbi:reverse transcriptase domain-containing protein [Tanacetum coccineum]
MEGQRNKFAPYSLPPQEGNMNGWLTEDANDSDLESTASYQPISLTMEDPVYIYPKPRINNANGNGNGGGNNGCTYKGLMACGPRDFDGTGGVVALTRWTEKMESVIDNSGCLDNQRVKYAASSFIVKALTWWNTQVQARGRDAANAMAWNDFKALLTTEFCPSNEIEKLEGEFLNHSMVGVNHAGYTDRFHELAKLVPHLVTPEAKHVIRILTDEAVAVVLWLKLVRKGKKGMRRVTWPVTIRDKTVRHAEPIPSVKAEMGREILALEGNRNTRGNENRARGRACNVNAVDALQDLNVVTGTIANPGYVIEVANGRKEEVDRIFCGCRLELGDSMFLIDLIPLGKGSFDVIV